MTSEHPPSGFSPEQRQLFEMTGLVFEIRVENEAIVLSLEGVDVFVAPHSNAGSLLEAVSSLHLPGTLSARNATLVQRRALIDLLTRRQSVASDIRDILSAANGDVSQSLATIARLEGETGQTVRSLIWGMDDVSIGRLASAFRS